MLVGAVTVPAAIIGLVTAALLVDGPAQGVSAVSAAAVVVAVIVLSAVTAARDAAHGPGPLLTPPGGRRSDGRPGRGGRDVPAPAARSPDREYDRRAGSTHLRGARPAGARGRPARATDLLRSAADRLPGTGARPVRGGVHRVRPGVPAARHRDASRRAPGPDVRGHRIHRDGRGEPRPGAAARDMAVGRRRRAGRHPGHGRRDDRPGTPVARGSHGRAGRDHRWRASVLAGVRRGRRHRRGGGSRRLSTRDGGDVAADTRAARRSRSLPGAVLPGGGRRRQGRRSQPDHRLGTPAPAPRRRRDLAVPGAGGRCPVRGRALRTGLQSHRRAGPRLVVHPRTTISTSPRCAVPLRPGTWTGRRGEATYRNEHRRLRGRLGQCHDGRFPSLRPLRGWRRPAHALLLLLSEARRGSVVSYLARARAQRREARRCSRRRHALPVRGRHRRMGTRHGAAAVIGPPSSAPYTVDCRFRTSLRTCRRWPSSASAWSSCR